MVTCSACMDLSDLMGAVHFSVSVFQCVVVIVVVKHGTLLFTVHVDRQVRQLSNALSAEREKVCACACVPAMALIPPHSYVRK